jgi:hypothetical protein
VAGGVRALAGAGAGAGGGGGWGGAGAGAGEGQPVEMAGVDGRPRGAAAGQVHGSLRHKGSL